MAAQAADYLVQADLLPPLGTNLWGISSIISAHSPLGEVLRVLVGYDARPSGLQLLFHVATLVVLGACMKLLGKPPAAPRPATAA